jgi:hypothetical protein
MARKVNAMNAVDHVLQFFAYEHLPVHLAEVSAPFHKLAHDMAYKFPAEGGREVTVGLRKLLEAKDCFVRAKLAK